MTFNGVGGTWQLAGAWNVGSSWTVTNGTLDTNGQTVTNLTVLSSNNSNVRTITLGASDITITGTTSITFTTSTNLTFTAGTSTIRCTAPSTFNGGGKTFATVIFSGGGTNTIGNHSNTFGTFTDTGTVNKTGALVFNSGTTQTVTGTFTVTGDSPTNRVLVKSSTVGTAYTINAAVVSLTNVDFQDATGAGAAAPFTGTSIGDCGGNSQVTGTTPVTRYWIGGTGSWSASSEWSASSGGAGNETVPLCHDTANFDANSFSAGSQTVTCDMPRTGKDVNFTGVTNTPALTLGVAGGSAFFGSLTFVSGMTVNGGGNGLNFEGRATTTFATAGLSVGVPVSVSVAGTTLTVTGNADFGQQAWTHNIGTIDFTSTNQSMKSFSTTNSNTRAVVGTGTLTLTATAGGTLWNAVTSTGLTVSSAPTIKFTSTAASIFAGGGKTYRDFWYAPGAGTGGLSITGANTFADFKDDGTVAHTITFPNVTTTVSSFTVSGNSGQLITLQRTGGSGTWTLSDASGNNCRDFLSISNSAATGGAGWYAGTGSTDGGGNTGWTFTACPAGGLLF